MSSKSILFRSVSTLVATVSIQACSSPDVKNSHVMQDQYSTRVCGILKPSTDKDVFAINDKANGQVRKFKASGSGALDKAKSSLNQNVCVDFWTSGSDPFFRPVTDPDSIRLASSLKRFEKCGVLGGPIVDSGSYVLTEIKGRIKERAGIHVQGIVPEFFHLIESKKRFCVEASWAPDALTEYTEILSLSSIRHEDGTILPAFEYGTLTAISDTFLKVRIDQASSLNDQEKCAVPKDSKVSYALKKDAAEPNNIEILLKSVLAKDGKTLLCRDFVAGVTPVTKLFLFAPHVK